MIIMNELPEDVPYITFDEAEAACRAVKRKDYDSVGATERAIAEKFNEIAGAPDFTDTKGVTRWVYYTDESHDSYIEIAMGEVLYVNQSTGKKYLITSFVY